ncbi:helix-turn-helix domain-containing protein [Brevibacillus borstelensis]|uniref:helix-turn-helix domain-containing protein n=1 Tax=Brevibacillus borstelensis TaxID=45462 RepID=UPI0004F245B4|nr:helix-turn-helix transcriptional regulator [Brevibacillus borstelensis]KKX52541.1 XRE family transcriptional regulator [Brevibacillus borstelensis cifa_chp40]
MDTLLKRIRISKGLSVEEMAKRLDIPAGYYSQIENQQRGVSVERGKEIAAILEVSEEEIFLTSRYALRKVDEKPA